MLPEDARYPDGNGKKRTMPRMSPVLRMTDLYREPGAADRVGATLEHYPQARVLFDAEIAYSRGQIDRVYDRAQLILSQRGGFYEVISGAMLLGQCAVWMGDLQMWNRAKHHLFDAPCQEDGDRTILELSLAAMELALMSMGGFPEWFRRGWFSYLPPDAHPAARVYYIKLLMIYTQGVAMDKYRQEGVSGLALQQVLPHTIEPFIAQAQVDKMVAVELYLRLMCAVVCHNIADRDRAVHHVDRAIALALPDGLLGALAEYRHFLGYLLDERLNLVDPEALRRVRELNRQYQSGWTKLHNAVLAKTVSADLSVREREVARLAVFGLTDAQIAQRLGVSKATVKSLISTAKNKTGALKRSQLVDFV